MRIQRTPQYRLARRVAIENGWDVGTTRKGHVRFESPTGAVVVTAGSPSDYRSVKNWIAELRRHGLPV